MPVHLKNMLLVQNFILFCQNTKLMHVSLTWHVIVYSLAETEEAKQERAPI